MKRFLLHSILFIATLILSAYLVYCHADGHTDAFYVKFTTPKQSSLIIGSSRAAQGIQPSVMNPQLDKRIYNYAFSRVHTPYGKPYFESIQQKLDSDSKNGVFVIEVNPWSICSKKNELLDSLNFNENKSFLGQVTSVTTKPNIGYLMKSFGSKNIDILNKKSVNDYGENLFVHNDGWFEVNIKDDTKGGQLRFEETIFSYGNIRQDYSALSAIRLDYLKKTINFLKGYGKVYLARLPIDDKLLEIENTLLPDFDKEMQQLADQTNIKYFNFMPDNDTYQYTDGHHLNISSGRLLSKALSDSIQKYQNRLP